MPDPAIKEARSILPTPASTPGSPTAVDVRDQSLPFVRAAPVRAPEDAPHVVVILVDDMGFGASSAFGGPCAMPVAEQLAKNGLRYTRFHTTALCSPTRAALMTGRNHHSVGFGTLVENSTGRPGYDAHRPASAATLARILAGNGYATGVFGKWHQAPLSNTWPAGPFEHWPTGEGFEKFYGFVGGIMNHWEPLLFDGTNRVEPPRTPEQGYHLSEDLVDRAIDWIHDVRTLRPASRFFCYLPFGATHVPHHVARTWVERYRGCFDHGWDEQRELTLRRQKELNVVPESTELGPWIEGIPHWGELSEVQRRAACALMEVYAGFAEHMDAQVGRLIDALSQQGVLDDTLIFYILGDNGAEAGTSALGEGGVNLYAQLNSGETWEHVLASVDVLGGPETFPTYPPGWAVAMDTPYQWYKSIASHYGGTRNGLIVHWPNGIETRDEKRHQWHHIIDVAPTILEAASLPQPVIVDGVPQMAIEGTAMNYSFDDPGATDRHTTQYFEMVGSRSVYHDGWVAGTPHRSGYASVPPPSLRDDVWELYDTTEDWSQARNVAHLYPEKLAQLRELFLIEAARHNVLPLDDRIQSGDRSATERATQAEKPRSMTFRAGTRALRAELVPNVTNRSHTVAALLLVPEHGARGVICAQGSRFSGWALFCETGLLTYCHNVGTPPHFYLRTDEPLRPGRHEVAYEFTYDGSRPGGSGTGALFTDGVKLAEGRLQRTAKFIPQESGFDVGADLNGVADDMPIGDNAFTGEIEWVRIDLGEGVENDPAEEQRVKLATQ